MDSIGLKDEAARMLLEKDALHIYAALVIPESTGVLTRRSLGDPLPWFTVLGFKLVNELKDKNSARPHPLRICRSYLDKTPIDSKSIRTATLRDQTPRFLLALCSY